MQSFKFFIIKLGHWPESFTSEINFRNKKAIVEYITKIVKETKTKHNFQFGKIRLQIFKQSRKVQNSHGIPVLQTRSVDLARPLMKKLVLFFG